MVTEAATAESTTTLIRVELPLGDRAEIATVVRWYVAPGDTVETGVAVCLLITECFLFDLPATASGIVETCFVQDGAHCSPGDMLLSIVPTADETSAGIETPQHATPRATPLARNIAAAHHLDLNQSSLPARDGRIWAAEVRAALGITPNKHRPTQEVFIQPRSASDIQTPRVLRDQRPQALTALEVTCEDAADNGAVRIVHAAIQLLIEHPWLNSCWTDTGVLLYGRIDPGLWRETAAGRRMQLLTSAADLSMYGIQQLIAGAAAGAQNVVTRTAPATFWLDLTTGNWWSEQLIPAGASALLHIGGAERRVVVEEASERMVIRTRRLLALSFDIRHIAQSEADAFLKRVRAKVEQQHSL